MRNILDLFSGAASGWSLGMHRAGYETIAACEIDPWRREQYQKNNPTVRIYDDVRTLTADRLHDDGLFPDIVVGSPPCQDISSANHSGKGVDGDRSGLFFEALRIIREIRPVWGCLENSPNLRNRGSDRVLGYLDAIGYACWPLVVGAKDVGANHIRRRVWLVFADTERCALREQPRRRSGTNGQSAPVAANDGPHPDRDGQPASALNDEMAVMCGAGGIASDANATWSGTRQSVERRIGLTSNDGRHQSARHFWDSYAPDFSLLDDGLSPAMARACISAYGDAVVPQIPEAIGNAMRRILHA